MVEWTRKNSFVRQLRYVLRGFRIVEVSSEHYIEANAIETGLGGTTHVPSGRDIIVIKLKGHWRE
jgi:hypothetical protein